MVRLNKTTPGCDLIIICAHWAYAAAINSAAAAPIANAAAAAAVASVAAAFERSCLNIYELYFSIHNANSLLI